MKLMSALSRTHDQMLRAAERAAERAQSAGDAVGDDKEAVMVTRAAEAARLAARRALEAGGEGGEAGGGGLASKVGHRAAEAYERMRQACEAHVQQLRVVLESAEAREKERSWLRLKQSGELDETRLVDAAVGERQVFKQRGTPPVRLGSHQAKPKSLSFLLDASASMARGDRSDGRLQRMGQTAVLLMEALRGFEHKYEYSLTAHSGASACVPLVTAGQPPASAEERARVVERLLGHAASCGSGDHSLEAARLAIEQLAGREADERLVFLLSDANLGRYDVSPEELGSVLRAHPKVGAYAIFVAEPGAAEWLATELPFGRGFSVQDTAKLPNTIKEIMLHSATTMPAE